MAGLLEFLMGNRAQSPDPWQGMRQTGQMGGGGFLQSLLAPEVALPMAAALMGQQGNGQNFANAFSAAGTGLGEQRKLKAQTAERNKTLDYLRQNNPDLAAMVDAGMPVNEAWQTLTQQRFAQAPRPEDRPASIIEYEYGEKNPEYAEWMKTKGRDAPLTATDKKAILDADEMVLNNQTTLDMLNSVLADPDGAGPQQSLNERAGYGATAGSQAWLARNDPTGFFNDEKGQATTELENVVLGQALSSLKSIFGAAPTEGERKILVDLQASIDKTPQERKIIIERAVALANKRLQFNQERAGNLRSNDYYKAPSPDSNTGNGWIDRGNGVKIRRVR